MMRSLYAGVSGLQNHQIRMDVLGNNIANVNTIGFKKGRVNFQDMLSQTMAGAAKPTDEVGGVNPKQVGLGMTVAAIDTIYTQGSLQTTGVMTDLSIQGNGFFLLKVGEKNFFSRAGAFGLDENGLLVNPANGMRVQGWEAQTIGGLTMVNVATEPQDLVIPVGSKDPAAATTEAFLACNLDKRIPVIPAGAGEQTLLEGTWTTTFDIYDSFGRAHKLQVNFTQVAGIANRWQAEVIVDPEAEIATNTLVEVGLENNTDNLFFLDFDNYGALQSVLDAQGDTLAEGKLQIPVSFDVPQADIPAGVATFRQTFNLNLGEVGAYTNAVTQFAEKSSTKVVSQNGYTMGYLESFKIDQSGVITGVYSNGTNRSLGQVALASFTNPGGLEKAGESTYVVSNNSGEANIGPAGVAGKGKIIAGTLEMSNVDLAEQFTDMIVTQRGFQANSRTITTSDQMLQELLNLKR
ncbi:MAG TPA: flagellar hook protein FlgE [Spirochaetales bacterium]|nr:flagellar hook protein FlgE [Spirochaetales bacterium]